MDQIARVIAVEGKAAVVEVERNSACAKCGICHMGETKSLQLLAENGIGAEVGKRVLVALDKRSFLKAGFIVYLLPLSALLGGIVLVYWLGGTDLRAVATGLGLFALAYLAIRLLEPVWKGNPEFTASIVRIVEDYEEISDYCGHSND
mgnify:CR=1 FL=1|jgi:sigma-E factor negative regulatory protein RseC